MNASEELRRMLDECGVEWWPLGSNMTECVIDGIRYKFRQVGRGLIVSTCTEGTVTPEQAIAATLGRGECHDNGGTGANGEQVFNCSECGCVLSLYDRDGSNNLCTSFIFDYPRYCPECGRKVTT